MITNLSVGCYRVPMAAGLKQIGYVDLGNAFEKNELKLGITVRLRTVDHARPEFKNVCIAALQTMAALGEAAPHVLQHYIDGLTAGTIMPSNPGGDVPVGNHSYAPGELFFKS